MIKTIQMIESKYQYVCCRQAKISLMAEILGRPAFLKM